VREKDPERVEPAERLADRTTAHAQRAREVGLDETLARYVAPGENAGSDVIDHAIRRRYVVGWANDGGRCGPGGGATGRANGRPRVA